MVLLMRILLPTGSITYKLVKEAAEGYPADIVVIGEVASFLSPDTLRQLLAQGDYDIALVSGMCTASFQEVERETNVPVYLGPRHASDLGLILPLLGKIDLSRTIPADEFIAIMKEKEASSKIKEYEENSDWDYCIRGVKIGGNARIKVLAEIMDAHKVPDLPLKVKEFFFNGADIVDLGFGFDASPDDVKRCFYDIADVSGPLAVDTQDPDLIIASLFRSDIILSLHEENIPVIGSIVAEAGVAAVVIPYKNTLLENIALAEDAGIRCIIADPVIPPVGSGFTSALKKFGGLKYPLFFGAGNVVELVDADSQGMNALLAGIAHELLASIIFTSEHSDKTRGSVSEMRRATEMMLLMKGRHYPKDLGRDLLIIKEKRRRREPVIEADSVIITDPAGGRIEFDPCGNFRIGIDDEFIVAEIHGEVIRGRHWDDIFSRIITDKHVSKLDHAAYLGKELYKAELAIRFNRSFEQDGEF